MNIDNTPNSLNLTRRTTHNWVIKTFILCKNYIMAIMLVNIIFTKFNLEIEMFFILIKKFDSLFETFAFWLFYTIADDTTNIFFDLVLLTWLFFLRLWRERHFNSKIKIKKLITVIKRKWTLNVYVVVRLKIMQRKCV